MRFNVNSPFVKISSVFYFYMLIKCFEICCMEAFLCIYRMYIRRHVVKKFILKLLVLMRISLINLSTVSMYKFCFSWSSVKLNYSTVSICAKSRNTLNGHDIENKRCIYKRKGLKKQNGYYKVNVN